MLVHYESTWAAMPRSDFVIVTTEGFYEDTKGNKKPGVAIFLSKVNTRSYTLLKIKDLIDAGVMYEFVVTNHIMSGYTTKPEPFFCKNLFKKMINRSLVYLGQAPRWKIVANHSTFLPLQVGHKQIRFMYGADISDSWSLDNWNEIYDIFLCHGVNDQKALTSRFKGECFIMGYPRYDRFYETSLDLNQINNEFDIDNTKKTLLWMPTIGGEYSSIPFFAEPLSELSSKYNIICRPHPLSFEQEPELILLLEKFKFIIDRNEVRDMNELFSIADIVLPDYGGTPFSAIFLNKNIIFLDVPNADKADINRGSSVLEIREHLPILKHTEVAELDDMISTADFYEANNKCINELFVKYFNSPRGGGAKRVAKYFEKLLN